MQGVADWKVRIKSNTSQFIARWIPEATCMKPQVCSAQDVDKFPILPKEWFWGILLLLVMIAGALYMKIVDAVLCRTDCRNIDPVS